MYSVKNQLKFFRHILNLLLLLDYGKYDSIEKVCKKRIPEIIKLVEIFTYKNFFLINL